MYLVNKKIRNYFLQILKLVLEDKDFANIISDLYLIIDRGSTIGRGTQKRTL